MLALSSAVGHTHRKLGYSDIDVPEPYVFWTSMSPCHILTGVTEGPGGPEHYHGVADRHQRLVHHSPINVGAMVHHRCKLEVVASMIVEACAELV